MSDPTTTTLTSWFETRTRDDGTTYTTLRDERPEWLYEAVKDAHDDELPNDWRFDTCRQIVEIIEGGRAVTPDELAEVDTYDIADSLVDVYTSDLLAWLSNHTDRLSYCDERLREAGGAFESVEALIRAGQFTAIAQMADVLIAAMQDAYDA